MTTKMLDPMNLSPTQARPLSLRAYLRAVDIELARLTCGLLTHSDFDVCWAAAWQAGTCPAKMVRHALRTDGFVVSGLPTPMMRQLANEREVRDGQA